MAESVDNTPTSLQYRLLNKKLSDLTPAKMARRLHIALLQGLRRASDNLPPVP